ncbi:unnamed protein product, partial [Sphacelaria rigidula]
GDRQVPACTTTEGRAKVSGIRLSGPLEGVAGDSFSHTVVAKVCSDLAKAGAVSDRPPTRGNFLSGYSQGGDKSSCQHSLANGFLWRERGDDWLQGFRFKLQALRDALLGGEEVRRGGEVEH